jgi:hypothetical protein
MSTTQELPKDLGGWQCVEHGPIMEGDVFGKNGKPIFWAEMTIGDDVSVVRGNAGVYRRIPVAKAGDLDEDWKKVGSGYREIPLAPATKAATYDDGKPPLARLPWAGIKEVAHVQAYGFEKYKDFDNYRKGMEVSRNLSCALRHIAEYMEGTDLDTESQCNHLAHAACRLLFVLQNIHDNTAIDDRPKKPVPHDNGSGLGQEPNPSQKTP